MNGLYSLQLILMPVVLAAATAEAAYLQYRRKQDYDWKAYFASLADMVGRRLVGLLPYSLAAPVLEWAYQHRLANIALDNAAAVALLFVGQEFCYYWYHRAAHRVRWFWATHAVHHTPNELNLAAAYRLGWTGKITGTTIFFSPLVLIGFPPGAVLATLTLNLLYQFWLHATWIPKLGWLEYVLNTPSHHRVHHACNVDYLDANFGGVLIVFDRLFGSFVAERADLPCKYGLTKPVLSYNPLFIAFHEWIALGRDLLGARSLREIASFLFGPPGWRPDGAGLTTEDMRHRSGAAAPSR